jgi:hypothetical protein
LTTYHLGNLLTIVGGSPYLKNHVDCDTQFSEKGNFWIGKTIEWLI